MKIKEIEVLKLKELKEKSKMLKYKRQKGEVIKRLNLENVICTRDALNTQKENIKAVIEKGGDYCVALKGNQGNFYKDFQNYFDEDRLLIIESGYEGGYQLTREKNHEAVITYEYYQTEKVNWYEEIEEWEGLKSIGLVKKTIEKSDGRKVEEKRYFFSCLYPDFFLTL